jgi:DNA-directed RNA polymerase
MFTSTKEIQVRSTIINILLILIANFAVQDWFTESARLISQIRGQNVEWVTPLGLPIVQPYMKETKKHGLNTKSKSKYINENFCMDSFG